MSKTKTRGKLCPISGKKCNDEKCAWSIPAEEGENISFISTCSVINRLDALKEKIDSIETEVQSIESAVGSIESDVDTIKTLLNKGE